MGSDESTPQSSSRLQSAASNGGSAFEPPGPLRPRPALLLLAPGQSDERGAVLGEVLLDGIFAIEDRGVAIVSILKLELRAGFSRSRLQQEGIIRIIVNVQDDA